MRNKSRRDGTLLTAGFSLRTNGSSMMKSPAGTTLDIHIPVAAASVVPAGLGRGGGYSVRRLKPTVNKVPSLRDLLRMQQFETKIGAVKRQFGAVNCSH
ncbi:MAG: hypothetical protein LBQ70_04470 [Prevotellaceae bacterium]|nr:hypothetical protein [Prevotellaceae bacterium]